jgi:hypothetical protein
MFGGVDFFGCCGSVNLRIPESSFSIWTFHSSFDQFRRKNYVTSIKYYFWCYKPYKDQINVSVRKILFRYVQCSALSNGQSAKSWSGVSDCNVRNLLPCPARAWPYDPRQELISTITQQSPATPGFSLLARQLCNLGWKEPLPISTSNHNFRSCPRNFSTSRDTEGVQC